MSTDGYMLFHHNLSFSSIPENRYGEVIDKCYTPLLELADNIDVILNIEMSGYTLEKIKELRPEYIIKINKLIAESKICFIGSGYSQIIGPLWPALVNEANLKIGFDVYQEVLSSKPKVALVNEMALTSSLIDVYVEQGYSAIVMDSDNVLLANNLFKKSEIYHYDSVCGSSGSKLPVFWSDSILFQKFQRVAHGTLDELSYFDYINRTIENLPSGLIPIYTNDAEVFNFRPGRFKEEANILKNEWDVIRDIIIKLQKNHNVNFVSLDEAVKTTNNTIRINSLSHPVIVKKQQKYNISRWAVTGRDDHRINTFAFKLINQRKKLTKHDFLFFSSDLRTHIVEERWNEFNKLALGKNFEQRQKTFSKFDEFDKLRNNKQISLKSDFGYCELDSAKGLALRELAFDSIPFYTVCSYDHGEFSDIRLGADFYSGMLLIEDVKSLRRYTDLSPCYLKKYKLKDLDVIESETDVWNGKVRKKVFFDKSIGSFNYIVNGQNLGFGISIIRLGNFLIRGVNSKTRIRVPTGGLTPEIFTLDNPVNHSESLSSLISSRTALVSSEGWIEILNEKNSGIRFEWDNHIGFLLPMLNYQVYGKDTFFRLIFSISEVDDTSKDRDTNFTANFRILPIGKLNE